MGFYKKGGYNVWAILIVIVIAYLIANNVFVTYASKPVDSDAYACVNGTVMTVQGGIFAWSGQWEAGFKCLEYDTSRCKLACDDATVVCKCQATIVSRYFSSKGSGSLFE